MLFSCAVVSDFAAGSGSAWVSACGAAFEGAAGCVVVFWQAVAANDMVMSRQKSFFMIFPLLYQSWNGFVEGD